MKLKEVMPGASQEAPRKAVEEDGPIREAVASPSPWAILRRVVLRETDPRDLLHITPFQAFLAKQSQREEEPLAKLDPEIARKADVAKVDDELNTFKGAHDRDVASLWKAIRALGAGADHAHVPNGHAPTSAERATGAVAAAPDPPPES